MPPNTTSDDLDATGKPDVEKHMTARDVLLGLIGVVMSVLLTACLWLFSTVQDHDIQLAVLEDAKHPFTVEDVRDLRATMGDLKEIVARLDQRLEDGAVAGGGR